MLMQPAGHFRQEGSPAIENFRHASPAAEHRFKVLVAQALLLHAQWNSVDWVGQMDWKDAS